ncbi:EamA family transporter RarD [Nonomuraea sp. KC401]|uniref:EamA family transporter RarD n=1 Tax=unclassified Nonomuraea TaxID=2593643 RepID=UPI0010FEF1AA|nr:MULTISPECIES: EamA family transporter RarD [unclassified Nonomuraea]NBE91678.1 EamA family transporter RarD [Nonomuraea sp. K271]TLF85862.1 EamA family transporter RarD [Nonomuraea sp. KC401]
MPDLRRGVLFGVAAYTMWGLFPLYWPLLKPSGAVEILAHRMVWSLVAVAAALAVRRHWSWIRELARRPGTFGLLSLAAVTITINWGTYIYAVNTGHVVESALGYFISPLVNVLFGVVLLRERLRPLQWAAVGFGALAVLVLTVDYGRPPWIALTLGMSFGAYGLVKKRANVAATESLAVETVVLLPPALGYLLFLQGTGASTFGTEGVGHAVLLASAGLVTAVPLLCFGAAAIRVPLSTIGLLQYIAPILQFACGVLIVREVMPPSRWIGFAIVWAALAVFTYDSLRTARAAARVRRSAAQSNDPAGDQPLRSTT